MRIDMDNDYVAKPVGWDLCPCDLAGEECLTYYDCLVRNEQCRAFHEWVEYGRLKLSLVGRQICGANEVVNGKTGMKYNKRKGANGHI